MAAWAALIAGQFACSRRLDAWTWPARQQAASIKTVGSLSFPRVAIQDAFRATVDAFGLPRIRPISASSRWANHTYRRRLARQAVMGACEEETAPELDVGRSVS
jgi:hypothetical protein